MMIVASETQQQNRGLRLTLVGAAAMVTLLAGTVAQAGDSPPTMEQEMQRLFGNKKFSDAKGKITIEAPQVAENGKVVPIGVDASGAGAVKNIYVFSDKNPYPLVGKFGIGNSAVAFIRTNMRLKQASNVVVVAELKNGKLLRSEQFVKVTLGGCGGGS